MDLAQVAKRIFAQTIERLRVPVVMESFVKLDGTRLCAGRLRYDLGSFRRIVVISVGKASGSMWKGIVPSMRRSLDDGQTIESIVVGPEEPGDVHSEVRYYAGDHPLPGPASRMAAEDILATLEKADEDTFVLFLISGGASAMVEKSIDPEMSEEDVRLFYQSLVHSGLPIGKMNALRKHFSAVKGGRLAVAARRAMQCTVLISDVPGNRLDAIGSGPSLPDSSTIEDCREAICAHGDALRLSPRIQRFFAGHVQETPKAEDEAFRKSDWVTMLSSDDLVRTAGQIAEELGFRVVIDNVCDDWDYRDAARYLVDRLLECGGDGGPACLLSCGELSVPLGPEHGVGGRNQQFALECSRLLARLPFDVVVLSGGSDGIDGNSPAAGAFCDRTTWMRAATQGLDAETALRTFNSFPLFRALDQAIMTGPTGNNLRDLRVLVMHSGEALRG